MKQKIILFTLLVFSFIGYSQIGSEYDGEIKVDAMEDERRLTDDEFERAKELYFKMLDSKDVKKRRKLDDELVKILGVRSGFRDFLYVPEDIDEEKIKNWVTKNVEDKKKKRVTKLLSKMVVIKIKINQDNAEVIQLFRKSSGDEAQEIRRSALKRLESKKK